MACSVLKTRLRVTRSSAFRKSALRSAHAAVLLLGVALPELAAAEVVEGLTPSAFDRKQPLRPTKEKPAWINRDDCLADDVLYFDIKVTSPSDNNFEVWVGDKDCKDKTMRTGANAECWQVWGKSAPTNSFQVAIKVQDVIAKRTNSNGEAHGSIDNCDDSWQSKLAFYFMYVDDTGDVSGTPATWNDSGVDIEGPLAPSNVTAGPGDHTLVAKWDSSDSLGLMKYYIYCAEAGEGAAPSTTSGDAGTTKTPTFDAGLVDAGLFADAAVDAAPTTATPTAQRDAATTAADAGAGSCWGAGLVEGKIPDDSVRLCGTVNSRVATKGFGTDVVNGTRYALAVSAVDELGNPGTLSNVACTIPANVTNYFEAYNAAGGGGGGGICAVAAIGRAPRGGAGTTLPLGAALVVGCGLQLRRRAVRGSARQGRKVNS